MDASIWRGKITAILTAIISSESGLVGFHIGSLPQPVMQQLAGIFISHLYHCPLDYWLDTTLSTNISTISTTLQQL